MHSNTLAMQLYIDSDVLSLCLLYHSITIISLNKSCFYIVQQITVATHRVSSSIHYCLWLVCVLQTLFVKCKLESSENIVVELESERYKVASGDQ